MESIFVLRHAVAEDISSTGKDFDRKLTSEGIKKTIKLAKVFNTSQENLNLVLSSPLLRAKQTAEIFLENIDIKPEYKIVDFLSSGVSVNEIIQGLKPYIELEKILIVGHAPDLGIFIGKLIGANRIRLKRGALAKISILNQFEFSGELEYLITSKIVKNLALV